MKRNHLVLSAILIFGLISACRPPELRKHEIRAVWMSRFEYAQNKDSEASKTYIRDAFRRFRKAGLNVVIFQVRGNADAFYQSAYEPWSRMLSDSLGKDPGWDPLQFAVNEARRQGLELHAWINTFPAWRSNEPMPAESEPLHPILAHPEWLVCDSAGNPMKPEHGYITFSPGNPEVQLHIQQVVMDIVEGYDVDGIHFDYIRYPEGAEQLGYSHDSVSVSRYRSTGDNPQQFQWNAWQREQINHFVSQTYNAVTSAKPWVKVSAAVIGHHYGGTWNGYHVVYQDARRWLAAGKMDLIFPMTYTRMEHPTAPYTSAIAQWKHMQHLGRWIAPGIATYKVGRQYDWQEIWNQIKYVREHEFPGMVFFSANSLLKKIEEIREDFYFEPALTPPLAWKDRVPEIRLSQLVSKMYGDSLTLNWQSKGPVQCFVLYKSRQIASADQILKIIPANARQLSLPGEGIPDTLYLTGINRVGEESEPQPFERRTMKHISFRSE